MSIISSLRHRFSLRNAAAVGLGVGIAVASVVGFARASHTTETWDGSGTGSSDNPNVTKTRVVNDGSEAYCDGMAPPGPDRLFHVVVDASLRDRHGRELRRRREERDGA